jgi:predicted DNA-binding transcriptional regulator YafY
MAPLTIAAAARHCGVARRTLQRAIKAGRLALTPDHQLTLEALQQAGYVAATPQGPVTATPQDLTPLVDRLDRIDGHLTLLLQQMETLLRTLMTAATPQEAPPRRTAAPPQDPVLAQILRWRQEGMSLQAIAARLNAEGIPTRSGKGQWYQSNLSRMLKRVGRGQYAGV